MSSGSQTFSETRGSRRRLRTFWNPSTVLITTCSPSVSTQVWVSWGEPSGMRVATKQGAAPRRRASRSSGRVTSPSYPLPANAGPDEPYDQPEGETQRLRLAHHQTLDVVLPHDRHELVDHAGVEVAAQLGRQ